MAPKPIVPMENGVDPREVEALIYMSVGVAIAFLLTASMMFAVCQCIAKYVFFALPQALRRFSSNFVLASLDTLEICIILLSTPLPSHAFYGNHLIVKLP